MKPEAIQEKLKTLPRAPGIYFHKDSSGEIIYIGKAAVLRNRVRQYFQSSRDFDAKTVALVEDIKDFDWIETETEVDALFLESEMVKRYMPRYNILLRDDKSQIYIRINMKAEWPHVTFTRNPLDDGAEYFGPYYNARAIRQALRYLRKVFPYYTRPPKVGERPSLDAHIGLDPANLTSSEYKKDLRQLISYVKGNRTALIREFESQMKLAADEQNFEKATEYRNRLRHLSELKRRISFSDSEAINVADDRALRLVRELFEFEKVPARIEGYDISHMSGSDVVASQVVFINGVSSRSDYRKYKMYSQRNDDVANIREVITRRFSGRNKKETWPDLILIDGGKGQLTAAVEALESLSVNVPIVSLAKSDEELMVYTVKSNIKTDRLKRFVDNPKRGVSVIKEGDFYIVNLHVGKGKLTSHAKNLDASVTQSDYMDVVKLFQRIRDESHRFAVSYHTTLKRKGQTRNVLEDIPGVGAKTRQNLIRKFGSVKGVIGADEADIGLVVGPAKAGLIKRHLQSD